MKAPAPIASLYNSTAHDNTVKSMTGTEAREQEICTPDFLLAGVRRMWGSIALDPCHSPKSLVNAERFYHVQERFRHAPTAKNPDRMVAYYEADTSIGEVDGLLAPWCDFTFVNPPFALLEPWMLRCIVAGEQCGYETMLLCPVRTHRKWWRMAQRSAKASGGGTFWLDPFAFIGETSASPFPLCLMYWGRLLATFELAFDEYGELDG